MRSLLPPALAAIALALTACGDESDKTFDQQGFPLTFEYPHAFEEVSDVDVDTNLGAPADQSAAIAIGDNDLILVERFTLNRAVERSDLDAAKQQFEELFRQLDPTVSSRVSEVAGVPALTIDAVDIPSVEDGQSRFVALLDGDQEYLFNCQSTPEHREEIEQACDMALETLTLDDNAASG